MKRGKFSQFLLGGVVGFFAALMFISSLSVKNQPLDIHIRKLSSQLSQDFSPRIFDKESNISEAFSRLKRTEYKNKTKEAIKESTTSLNQDLNHEKFDEQLKNTSVPNINMNEDKHLHHDDNEVAEQLKKEVKVLIWVMTSPKTLLKKAKTIRDTWGKRPNKIIFFSSENNTEFPVIGLNVSEGRAHLTAKTMLAFRYIYDNHFNDADWFMKADDDTYVIVENLRYFLSNQDKNDPVYFGHHFRTIVKQGYYSGGGGYVLSKEALKRFGEKGKDVSLCRSDGGPEDAEMGKCMENLGVRTANSTDAMGRSRFHCFDPETHLFGHFPDWYYHYDANGAKKGQDHLSDYAISFHYVPPEKMLSLEYYIYHLRPYGIKSNSQNLNVPREKTFVKKFNRR